MVRQGFSKLKSPFSKLSDSKLLITYMLCRSPYKGNVNLVPLNKFDMPSVAKLDSSVAWKGVGIRLYRSHLIGNTLFSMVGNSGLGRTRVKDVQLP